MADPGGQLASADPDADNPWHAKLAHGGEEILGRLLIREPTDRAYHRCVGGKAQRAARAVPSFRRAGGKARSHCAVHRDADGPHPVRRHQAPPDRLDRHSGPDAQRHVRDAAQSALDRDVRTATAAGLKLVEREAVIRMDDPRHRDTAGGETADGTRLRGVRMDHVKPALPEQGAESAQRLQITARVDGGAQRRLDDHLQASHGRLIEQVVAAAGDDRRLELIMIKYLGAT